MMVTSTVKYFFNVNTAYHLVITPINIRNKPILNISMLCQTSQALQGKASGKITLREIAPPAAAHRRFAD
jgi:hypothetical protein